MRTAFLLLLLVSASGLFAELPEPSAEKLPRWLGFNLLEKFYFKGRHEPFIEEDFRLIAELGFNFVRLPMDYRGWIRGGDWEQLDEDALRQIDEAVTWGGKHGIHVCINFHRAPGYTVANPPEARSLWTDAEEQRVCAMHWAAFARRYREVPNARLSSNLLNDTRRGGPRGVPPRDVAARGRHPRRGPEAAHHRRRPEMGPGADGGVARAESGLGDSRLHADGDQPLRGELCEQSSFPQTGLAAQFRLERPFARRGEKGAFAAAGDRGTL